LGSGDDELMAQIKSWTVSDALWSKVEPLIPARAREAGRKYQRKAGAGRKPMVSRRVFAAIVYVLRTGIQWKALPREFGSASAVHQYFLNWHRAGFFQKLWQTGLAEYDGMHGIAWQWQSADGAMGKAPLATECAGPNPTDRGKKRAQTQRVGRRPWNPAVNRRQRRKSSRLQAIGSDAGSGCRPAS
jgi:transposase